MQDPLNLDSIPDRLHKQPTLSNHVTDTNTVYDCLNIFKRKVISSGLTGNPSLDIQKQMQSSFEAALASSPNAEEIVILEEPNNPIRMAIITENGDVDWNKNDKNIAIPFSQYAQPGNAIRWNRTDDVYLIMAQSDTQKAYFSGVLRYASFLIKWAVDGVIYQQWAVVDGPGKTGGGFDLKSSADLIVDDGQHDVELYLPKTQAVLKIKRYDRLVVNDKTWRVMAINNFETNHFTKLYLKENYVDPERDDLENGIASNEEPNVDNFKSRVLDDLLPND